MYLVQPIGMDPNNELVLKIFFRIDAFKRASASSITVIVPYFGYAKGDKKDEPRVSIRARVCADCIEVVGADRFITMDLHAPQIQGGSSGFHPIISIRCLCSAKVSKNM